MIGVLDSGIGGVTVLKEIIKLIAKNQKVSKNEIYQYFLKIKI